jgi:hypothetical protein
VHWQLWWTRGAAQVVQGQKLADLEGTHTSNVCRACVHPCGCMLVALLIRIALCCCACSCVAVLQDLQDQGPQVCWCCTQGVQACGCA